MKCKIVFGLKALLTEGSSSRSGGQGREGPSCLCAVSAPQLAGPGKVCDMHWAPVWRPLLSNRRDPGELTTQTRRDLSPGKKVVDRRVALCNCPGFKSQLCHILSKCAGGLLLFLNPPCLAIAWMEQQCQDHWECTVRQFKPQLRAGHRECLAKALNLSKSVQRDEWGRRTWKGSKNKSGVW